MARKFNRVRESVARTTRSQSQRNLDGASFSVIQFMALVARLARLHSSNEELWVQTNGLTGTWFTCLRDLGRISGSCGYGPAPAPAHAHAPAAPAQATQLCTSYLKLALDDFGGSQAMAAADCNAGPSRPRKWREGPMLEVAAWAAPLARATPTHLLKTRNCRDHDTRSNNVADRFGESKAAA